MKEIYHPLEIGTMTSRGRIRKIVKAWKSIDYCYLLEQDETLYAESAIERFINQYNKQQMEQYIITKEQILELAGITMLKGKLKELFPQVFEDEKYAMRPDKYIVNEVKATLIILCKESGLGTGTIQVLSIASTNALDRGFYLDGKYKWELREQVDGYSLIPYNR